MSSNSNLWCLRCVKQLLMTILFSQLPKASLFVSSPSFSKTVTKDSWRMSSASILLFRSLIAMLYICLLYTSDAADEEDSVDLGGRRIIKKKKKKTKLKIRK